MVSNSPEIPKFAIVGLFGQKLVKNLIHLKKFIFCY
jgi:hypothetical protein